MGKKERAKGRRGQLEATFLLKSMNYIVSELNSGKKSADLIVSDNSGISYAVEVKNQKQIDILKTIKQAKENASEIKMNWMVLIKIGYGMGWILITNKKCEIVGT